MAGIGSALRIFVSSGRCHVLGCVLRWPFQEPEPESHPRGFPERVEHARMGAVCVTFAKPSVLEMESRLGRRAAAGRDSQLLALVLCAPPPPQGLLAVLPLRGRKTQSVTCMAFEPGQLAECPELSLLRNLSQTQQVEK